MKAMILAAGLGTRLKPFTDTHPKALFEIEGRTLLEHAIEHVKSAGIREVIINVHHFAGQITDYLNRHDNFGTKVTISDESGELLETGGGVKKAAWFFRDCDCAIIRNVDILSDLNLLKITAHHRTTGSLATLAVRKRETSRYFLFDHDMQLCGWENRKTGERVIARESKSDTPYLTDVRINPTPGYPALTNPDPEFPDGNIPGPGSLTSYAFSGIQVLSPEIFPLITENGKFSLTSLYLRLAKEQKITGYPEDGNVWEDVGRKGH